jgi:hypothetical protein
MMVLYYQQIDLLDNEMLLVRLVMLHMLKVKDLLLLLNGLMLKVMKPIQVEKIHMLRDGELLL